MLTDEVAAECLGWIGLMILICLMFNCWSTTQCLLEIGILGEEIATIEKNTNS